MSYVYDRPPGRVNSRRRIVPPTVTSAVGRTASWDVLSHQAEVFADGADPFVEPLVDHSVARADALDDGEPCARNALSHCTAQPGRGQCGMASVVPVTSSGGCPSPCVSQPRMSPSGKVNVGMKVLRRSTTGSQLT